MSNSSTKKRLPGVVGNRDFIKLWTSETISLFGSQVSFIALPLLAIYSFGAGPGELGLLSAVQFAPYLLFTLFVGAWLDRVRRKPVLFAANLARGLLLLLIPSAAWSGWLRIELLYAVGFLMGTLTVFFDLAYQAYVPSLVNGDQLVDANSKLMASASAAEIGGPGLGGVLVSLISAPTALLADAASYLAAAFGVAIIRKREPLPGKTRQQALALGRQIWEGIQRVARNPTLRALLGEAMTYNFFFMAISAIFILFATQELNIGPGMLGLVFSLANIGAFAGALIAGWLEQHFGLGNTIVGAVVIGCLAPILFPLASGAVAPFFLMAGYFGVSLTTAVANVHFISLRQKLMPRRWFGRMNASYRFFVTGAVPLGSLLGGALGEWIGLRPTLLVCALGIWTAAMPILFSPVRSLQSKPVERARRVAPTDS